MPQVVFLSQLFLKALLEVRNDILARSIRTACQDAIVASAAAGAGSDDEGDPALHKFIYPIPYILYPISCSLYPIP